MEHVVHLCIACQARGSSSSSSNEVRLCRAVDPFLKKEWYDIKAPSIFEQRQVGKTLITRTQGTKVCNRSACL